MYRWITDRLRRRALHGDRGFTVIEVMVAIVVFGTAAAAVGTLMVAAARATTNAKAQSQAKSLVQEQVERMRNLPFHVDATQGNFLDVLDTYYPNLVAPASASPLTALTAHHGWVSSSGSRFAGEPSTGPFYRWASDEDTKWSANQFPPYRLVVDTQFLTANRSPLTPQSMYDTTQTDPVGAPTSMLLGVTLTAAWSQFGKLKTFNTYTQISDVSPADPLIVSKVQAAAVQILSRTDPSTALELSAAAINANGASSTGANATVNAIPASAAVTSGQSIQAKGLTVSAPPNVTTTQSMNDSGHDLDPGNTCSLACFGQSDVTGGLAGASNGLPTVGDVTTPTPVRADLAGTGAAGSRGFSYSNSPSNTALDLASGQPLVTLRDTSGSSSLASSSALLNATNAATSQVTAKATTRVQVLELFPTTFTPPGRGVIEVVLASAKATCVATKGATPAASATTSWQATVSYWNPSINAYSKLGGDDVTNGGSNNLSAIDLSTIVVGTGPTGTVHHLSDYVDSINGLLSVTPTVAPDGTGVSVQIPAVVSITTTQTRSNDPTSAIGLQIGVLSCDAEDRR